MRMFFTILICKLLRFFGGLIGKGSSLPGQIALKLCPDILDRITLPEYIIAVTGSNGKTSTVEMIAHILTENGKTWQDITEIEFMSGPGSFTGLRIGASIVNTLAHELNIPLYDHHGTKHKQIIPDYGRPANISKPQK